MPEIGSGDDKELISFPMLFTLNILCDVIQHVDLIDRANGQFRKRMASVIAAKSELIEHHFD